MADERGNRRRGETRRRQARWRRLILLVWLLCAPGARAQESPEGEPSQAEDGAAPAPTTGAAEAPPADEESGVDAGPRAEADNAAPEASSPDTDSTDPGPEEDSETGPSASDEETAGEPPDAAARIEALEQELASQRQRLDELEQLQGSVGPDAASSSESDPSEASDASEKKEGVAGTMREDPLAAFRDDGFPGSVPLFGSDVRLAVGGYVKLDVIYDFGGTGDRYKFTIATIPTSDAESHQGYFQMHARETRFNLDLRYAKPGLPFNQAFIEIDFFTTSYTGFAAPRLRHAYFRWADFLAGQTWRILTDLRPLPFIVDFAFADALNTGRAPQLRWERYVTDWLGLRAGIEMPATGGVENPGDEPGQVSPRLPILAMTASLEHPWAFLSLGASVSEIRWDGIEGSPDASALGWATVLNARSYLDPRQRAFLSLHASVGRGSAETTVGVFSDQPADATLTPSGALDTMLAYSVVVGYAHRWIEQLSTNAAFAWDRLDPTLDRGDDQMTRTWSFHGNVIWTMSVPIQTGIEYMAGKRRNADGTSGTSQRVQAMAMYSF